MLNLRIIATLALTFSYVYGKGSKQLAKGTKFPNLANTAIFLKTRSKPNGPYDRVLMLRSTREEWMTPGGQIDGSDNVNAKYADKTFEGAMVREFLEETGLATFPKVKNAVYYNWGNPKKGGPHTRVFLAETDVDLSNAKFSYQPNEANGHELVKISYLTSNNAHVKWEGESEPIRPSSLSSCSKLLRKSPPKWCKKIPSDGATPKTLALDKFEGACLWHEKTSKRKGNVVVRKGAQPPAGFLKGSYWKPHTGSGQPVNADGSTPGANEETPFFQSAGGIITIVIIAIAVIALVVFLILYCRRKESGSSKEHLIQHPEARQHHWNPREPAMASQPENFGGPSHGPAPSAPGQGEIMV